MSEDTAAGPCDNLTEAISFDQAITQVAWSLEEPVYDYPPTFPPTLPPTLPPVLPQSSRWTHGGLKVTGTAATVLAGAVALAALLPRAPAHQPPAPVVPPVTLTQTLPPVTATETETLPPSTTTVAPAPDPGTDSRYLSLFMTGAGYGSVPYPADWIRVGHEACDYMTINHLPAPAGFALLHRKYGHTEADKDLAAASYAARDVYCPQVPYD